MLKKDQMTRRGFAIACAFALCAALAGGMLAGCSGGTSEEAQEPVQLQAETKTLEGHELNIYCGAGMTDPFQKIADAFEAETGCMMNVTFANADYHHRAGRFFHCGFCRRAQSGDRLRGVERRFGQAYPRVGRSRR